jgi:multidrug efflux pump subunit AcrA (membrane-fusion protein)
MTSPTPHPSAPSPGPSGRIGKIVLFLSLIVFGASILFFMNWQSRRREAAASAPVVTAERTAKVERGSVEQVVRVTGVTTAARFAQIEAPRTRGGFERTMNIVKLAPSGSIVRKGEVVAELDAQRLKDQIDDDLNTLRDRKNDLEKLKVQQELDMENVRQNLRVAKAQLDKAILDQKTTEVRTAVDQELLQLAVEEADAQHKELQADVAQTEASQRAARRISEITLRMQEIRMERLNKDLERYTIHAPMDGLVVYQTLNRPGGDTVQIQTGDAVNPGQPILKIVDQKSMVMEGSINQTESSLLRLGQKAKVGLDAFPGSGYEGKVWSIGALATRGFRDQYFLRTIPVKVQMENPDAKVIPDLSASADIRLKSVENVVVAPTAAVNMTKDGKAYVFVQQKNGFQQREIAMGINNGIHVAVLSGLSEGDVVRVN